MEAFRVETAALPPRVGGKEHNWQKELPLPARLAMFSAWATLLGSLALTTVAWQSARLDIEKQASERFQGRLQDIEQAVMYRMKAQEQVLRGARGLFDASSRVTRGEWRAYVHSLQLERTYPGILGIGFAPYLRPTELQDHIRRVRAEGFPGYDVHPPGPRPEYTSIAYIEPFNWRNQRAFGFDMFTEPKRREAMETARDTGNPSVTGMVTLVQETKKDVQAGFLMYLPVYAHGVPSHTLADRRQALIGYVFSPFRVSDLMAGILGRQLADVNMKIYDGNTVSASNLMYDSQESEAPTPSPRDFSAARTITTGNHQWTLVVRSLPGFRNESADQRPKIILQAGTFISLLMFVVVWSLTTLQKRAIVLAEDMTAALRESREQFQATSETANDPIISADSEGRITYFNGAAERVFGFRRSEAMGQPLSILMPDRLQAAHRAGFERVLTTGETRLAGKTIAMVARRRDGREFPIEISIACWSTGEGVFFTAILRDISERVAAEAKIQQLNSELQHQVEQLAEVNRELESFSYSVSHDLRAPLRAINGFARLLEEQHGHHLGEEGRRLLDVILDSSRKMGHLIDDLLAFARLGQTAIARSSVDMHRLVQETVNELLQTEECDSVRFFVSELPAARGDKALLRQVWMNLLSNAVKFSRPRPEPQVEAGGLSVGGEYHYFVRDNGVGFDMAYADQLFGVFKRLHKAEHFPGTGVGLAIVQRIVAKHGGRVWAESQPDAGAVFYFSLPADKA